MSFFTLDLNGDARSVPDGNPLKETMALARLVDTFNALASIYLFIFGTG